MLTVKESRLAAVEALLREVEERQVAEGEPCIMCGEFMERHTPDCRLAAALGSAPAASSGEAREAGPVMCRCGHTHPRIGAERIDPVCDRWTPDDEGCHCTSFSAAPLPPPPRFLRGGG